jgi:polyketide synthase PksN
MVSVDDDDTELTHCEGRLATSTSSSKRLSQFAQSIDLHGMMARARVVQTNYREACDGQPLAYGPSFQTVRELYVGRDFVLAKLVLPDDLRNDFSSYLLHPCLMDGAFQSVAGFLSDLEPGLALMPFGLEQMAILRPLPRTCYSLVSEAHDRGKTNGVESGIRKYNVSLATASGEVVVTIRNLYVRPYAASQERKRLAEPVHAMAASALT